MTVLYGHTMEEFKYIQYNRCMTIKERDLKTILAQVNEYVESRLKSIKYDAVECGPCPQAFVIWSGYLLLYEKLKALHPLSGIDPAPEVA